MTSLPSQDATGTELIWFDVELHQDGTGSEYNSEDIALPDAGRLHSRDLADLAAKKLLEGCDLSVVRRDLLQGGVSINPPEEDYSESRTFTAPHSEDEGVYEQDIHHLTARKLAELISEWRDSHAGRGGTGEL